MEQRTVTAMKRKRLVYEPAELPGPRGIEEAAIPSRFNPDGVREERGLVSQCRWYNVRIRIGLTIDGES